MIPSRTLLAFFIWIQFLATFGLGKKFPFQFLGENGLQIGAYFWGTLTALSLGLILTSRGRVVLEKILHPTLLWSGVGALALLTPVYDAFQWVKFGELGYPMPVGLWLLDGIGAVAWLFAYRKKISLDSPTAVSLAAVLAFAHRSISILTLPLVTARSDMFAAILQANSRFFELGLPAYAPSVDGVGQIPYLPLSWLSFFPASFASFDPRWIGLIVFAVTLGLLMGLRGFFERRKTLGDWSPALLMTLFLSNPYFHFRHELYLDPWFLTLVACLISLGKPRPWITGLLTGIAAATLHWAWTLFPFLWGISSLSLRRPQMVRNLALSASFALIPFGFIMGYFARTEGSLFFNAIFLHQDKIKTGVNPGELCLGFASLFFEWGLESWLQPIQIVLLLSVGVWGLRLWWNAPDSSALRPIRDRLLVLLWSAGFGFNLFVPFLENYFMLSWSLAAIPILHWLSEAEKNTRVPS